MRIDFEYVPEKKEEEKLLICFIKLDQKSRNRFEYEVYWPRIWNLRSKSTFKCLNEE